MPVKRQKNISRKIVLTIDEGDFSLITSSLYRSKLHEKKMVDRDMKLGITLKAIKKLYKKCREVSARIDDDESGVVVSDMSEPIS